MRQGAQCGRYCCPAIGCALRRRLAVAVNPPALHGIAAAAVLCCRVSRVGEGWIELERPLIYDLRTEWQVGSRRGA